MLISGMHTNDLATSLKDNMCKAYHKYVDYLTSYLSSNPKRFWSFVKTLTGTSSLPSSIEYNRKCYSPETNADIFNTFFQSVFNEKVEDSTVPPSSLHTEHSISDLHCTEKEVAKLLTGLDASKSSGPDNNIHPRILKECAKELASYFTKVFNHSLRIGHLPSDWMMANVVPIFKSGDRVLANNYRPISLTSNVVKILERLLHKLIMDLVIKTSDKK